MRGIGNYQKSMARKRNTYRIIGPDGVVHNVDNLVEFCRGKGLKPNGLRMVANGHRTHYKGWGAEKVEEASC